MLQSKAALNLGPFPPFHLPALSLLSPSFQHSIWKEIIDHGINAGVMEHSIIIK